MHILFIIITLIIIIILQFIVIISNNWIVFEISTTDKNYFTTNTNLEFGLWKGCINRVCEDINVSKSSSTVLISRIFSITSLILLIISCILLFLTGMTTKNTYLILTIISAGILSISSALIYNFGAPSLDDIKINEQNKLSSSKRLSSKLMTLLELFSGIILIILFIILIVKKNSNIEK